MSLPAISAGTGPAAAIIVGGLLLFTGNSLGILLIAAGFVLSALWALRFR